MPDDRRSAFAKASADRQRTEDRPAFAKATARQAAEDRRQKTEGRRQKTEDRKQKTEDRRQKAEQVETRCEEERFPIGLRRGAPPRRAGGRRENRIRQQVSVLVLRRF